MRKLAVLLATMSIVTSTFADNYAIVGGKIHTMGSQGIVDQGTILLEMAELSRYRVVKAYLKVTNV